MKYSVKILTIASLLVYQIGLSQQLSKIESNDIDTYLSEQIADRAPGLAVGIVKEGKVIYQKYLGLANLSNNIPISSSTRFNIASTAKQYTALCILKLASEGKLNLEDDFRK